MASQTKPLKGFAGIACIVPNLTKLTLSLIGQNETGYPINVVNLKKTGVDYGV